MLTAIQKSNKIYELSARQDDINDTKMLKTTKHVNNITATTIIKPSFTSSNYNYDKITVRSRFNNTNKTIQHEQTIII